MVVLDMPVVENRLFEDVPNKCFGVVFYRFPGNTEIRVHFSESLLQKVLEGCVTEDARLDHLLDLSQGFLHAYFKVKELFNITLHFSFSLFRFF